MSVKMKWKSNIFLDKNDDVEREIQGKEKLKPIF